MPLINCEDCGRQLSTDAKFCPSCGKPNNVKVVKEQNSKQFVGCFLFIVGICLCFFLPIIGIPILLIGLILAIINTRLK